MKPVYRAHDRWNAWLDRPFENRSALAGAVILDFLYVLAIVTAVFVVFVAPTDQGWAAYLMDVGIVDGCLLGAAALTVVGRRALRKRDHR